MLDCAELYELAELDEDDDNELELTDRAELLDEDDSSEDELLLLLCPELEDDDLVLLDDDSHELLEPVHQLNAVTSIVSGVELK